MDLCGACMFLPFWVKFVVITFLLGQLGLVLGSDDVSAIRDLLLQTNLLEEKDFLLWTSDSRGFVPLYLQCRYELEVDEGCPQRYLEEMPYVWQYEYAVDPTMFLQMDFQRPHRITRIKQVHITDQQNPSVNDSLYIGQVKVTFSRVRHYFQILHRNRRDVNEIIISKISTTEFSH